MRMNEPKHVWKCLIAYLFCWFICGCWNFGRNFAQHREKSGSTTKRCKEYNLTQSWNPFTHAEKHRPNPKWAKRIQTSCSVWSYSRAQSFFKHRNRGCQFLFSRNHRFTTLQSSTSSRAQTALPAHHCWGFHVDILFQNIAEMDTCSHLSSGIQGTAWKLFSFWSLWPGSHF